MLDTPDGGSDAAAHAARTAWRTCTARYFAPHRPRCYLRDFLRADGIGRKVGGIDRVVTVQGLVGG